MANISKHDLMAAGVITGKVGGSDWKRFNDDPMMFVMKLPRERLPALCELLDVCGCVDAHQFNCSLVR